MAYIPADSYHYLYTIGFSSLKSSQTFFTPNTHYPLSRIVYDTINLLINVVENKDKHKSKIHVNYSCAFLKIENVLEFFNNINDLFKTCVKYNSNYVTNNYLFNIWLDYYRFYSELYVKADNIVYNVYYKNYDICIPPHYFKMIVSATDSMIKQYIKSPDTITTEQKPIQDKPIQEPIQAETYANTNIDVDDSSEMWNPFVSSIVKNVFDSDDDCDDCNNDYENKAYHEIEIEELNDAIEIEEKIVNEIKKYKKRGGRRVREQRLRKQRKEQYMFLQQQAQNQARAYLNIKSQ
jgi:hypothetical protein